MRMFLRTIIAFLFACLVLSLSAFYFWYKPKFKESNSLYKSPKAFNEEVALLKTRSVYVRKYIRSKHFNSSICFLVDMNIASGKNRFFVYDLVHDSILSAGLVAHGSCDNGFQTKASFSNKANSGCSCLGKFKIGKSYNGRFGLAYKLYGLDSSNNNAYERNVVLHSYECVPERETYPLPICNSRGCAMVSAAFLQKLKAYLDKMNKPILLYIFNG